MRVFLTGVAGFIGAHVAHRLLVDGHRVIGYDALTDYYDPQLKRDRLALLEPYDGFSWIHAGLEEKDRVMGAVEQAQPDIIVHLGAQAGVRYSIEEPDTYVTSNLIGTYNILEAARAFAPTHLLFASTSSVYGGNDVLPFRESQATRFPISLYAATKTAGEAMSHSYSHLFGVPTTCFRFFTVYGPWGRPDMALFKFVDRIERGDEIDIYGQGEMRRDFTYIDDLVEAIIRLIDCVPAIGDVVEHASGIDTLSPVAPWRVVNIAGGSSVQLMDFVAAIESHLGILAKKRFLPMQPGDVSATWADSSLLKELTGYQPQTPVDVGVEAFVEWYRGYRRV